MKTKGIALAADIADKLEEAGMHRTLAIVKEKMLAQDLCEDDGELKPYVELVLISIRDTVKSTLYSPDAKHDMVLQWLRVGGF